MNCSKAGETRPVGCCMKSSTPIEMEHLEGNPFDCATGQIAYSSRARKRWCTMREEFVSYSFLAVAVSGVVLLCSGLVAIAFT
jgi:hypothetical protein